MVSSGIRIGAWDFLQWKYVEPITEKTGEAINKQFFFDW